MICSFLKFRSMSMDVRRLRRDAQTMLETFPWFSGERFDCIVRDLQSMPAEPLTLVEGFRLLPGLVHPLLDERREPVWLTTTPEFRCRAFMIRAQPEQFWCRTSDPPTSLERVLECDAPFADRITRQAQERNLKVVVVDGTQTETEVVTEVAAWFRLSDTKQHRWGSRPSNSDLLGARQPRTY